MKHLLAIISFCGGVLFLCPTHSRAEPYILSYSLVSTNRGIFAGSRTPKRPLVVDLVGHTLTLPSQVIGNTLTLESEKGEVYTYYIVDTTIVIPQNLKGCYKISIMNGEGAFQGNLDLY